MRLIFGGQDTITEDYLFVTNQDESKDKVAVRAFLNRELDKSCLDFEVPPVKMVSREPRSCAVLRSKRWGVEISHDL